MFSYFSFCLVDLSFGPNTTTLSLLEFLIEDEFVSNLSAGKEILRENGMVRATCG